MTNDPSIGDGAQLMDIQQQAATMAGYGLVDPDGVTIDLGSDPLTVDVSIGTEVYLGGPAQSVSDRTGLVLPDPDPDDPRKAIVYLDPSGSIDVDGGIPAPADPAGEERRGTINPQVPLPDFPFVPLAEVWIPADTDDIVSGDISSRRIAFDPVPAVDGRNLESLGIDALTLGTTPNTGPLPLDLYGVGGGDVARLHGYSDTHSVRLNYSDVESGDYVLGPDDSSRDMHIKHVDESGTLYLGGSNTDVNLAGDVSGAPVESVNNRTGNIDMGWQKIREEGENGDDTFSFSVFDSESEAYDYVRIEWEWEYHNPAEEAYGDLNAQLNGFGMDTYTMYPNSGTSTESNSHIPLVGSYNTLERSMGSFEVNGLAAVTYDDYTEEPDEYHFVVSNISTFSDDPIEYSHACGTGPVEDTDPYLSSVRLDIDTSVAGDFNVAAYGRDIGDA